MNLPRKADNAERISTDLIKRFANNNRSIGFYGVVTSVKVIFEKSIVFVGAGFAMNVTVGLLTLG
jgi:hypothetical protein